MESIHMEGYQGNQVIIGYIQVEGLYSVNGKKKKEDNTKQQTLSIMHASSHNRNFGKPRQNTT